MAPPDHVVQQHDSRARAVAMDADNADINEPPQLQPPRHPLEEQDGFRARKRQYTSAERYNLLLEHCKELCKRYRILLAIVCFACCPFISSLW